MLERQQHLRTAARRGGERMEAAEKHVPARKGVKEDPVVRDSMVFWDKEFIIRELLPG